MAEIITAPTGMTRTQRRRLKALAEKVDLITAADARFFERWPDRNYRIRIMAAVERDEVALVNGSMRSPTPDGEQWIVAVRRIARGVRERRFLTIMRGSDLDQSEDVCRGIFEVVSSGQPARAKGMLEELWKRGGNVCESGKPAVK